MYQCYYHKTYGERQYLGKKILTECFEKEIEAELYCDKYQYMNMEFEETISRPQEGNTP